MTKRYQTYKCEICGNITKVMHEAGGVLFCCNKAMVLQVPNSDEVAALEKHLPVIEKSAKGYKVTVSTELHPMTEDHYIEWIELRCETKTHIKFLEPGEEPVADFETTEKAIRAESYCNLHGLWGTDYK